MIDTTRLAPAIEEVRSLVRADGGDLVFAGVDGTAVHLTLVIEDAGCAECVMPKPFLEDVALDVVRRSAPDVTSVVVDDPRQRPDAS